MNKYLRQTNRSLSVTNGNGPSKAIANKLSQELLNCQLTNLHNLRHKDRLDLPLHPPDQSRGAIDHLHHHS
jgi:hypothetical protein